MSKINKEILKMTKNELGRVQQSEELRIAQFNYAAGSATGATITGVRGIDSTYLAIECEDGELLIYKDSFDGYILEWDE